MVFPCGRMQRGTVCGNVRERSRDSWVKTIGTNGRFIASVDWDAVTHFPEHVVSRVHVCYSARRGASLEHGWGPWDES
ncbi:hypothetical protein J6590_008377 [Homalodisca vitripennis]|nr:hypothetical protein J6590_008377 [Homalodisca vitripennis]